MPVRAIDDVQLAMPSGGEGAATAFSDDPFGNRIELMEPCR